MRNAIFLFVFAVLAAIAAPLPVSPALAAAEYSALSESRTPLVILRFTTRTMYYEHALYNAVSKAVDTKHDVVFDVILRPGNGSSDRSGTLEKVVNSMRKMGVPAAQIAATSGPGSGTRYDEVHIFVR